MDIDKVDEFLRLFDDECVEEREESFIELSRSDLNGETKIIVLRRQGDED